MCRLDMNKNKRPLNVCHVISSLKVGGAERQCINTVNELHANKKFILSLSDNKVKGLYDQVDLSVVQLVHLPVRIRTILFDVFKIANFFKRNEINVVHTHMYWPNVYGVLAAYIAGVKVVVTSEHGLNPWKKWWHHYIEKYILTPVTTMRICVSDDIMLNRMAKDNIPANKLCVMSNGTIVGSAPAAKDIEGVIKLLAVGRLVSAKDYPTLIKAVQLLVESGVTLELHILGDGNERELLDRMVKENDLQANVYLEGGVSNTEQWFESSDIFVMSSIREGQPMALLEAMAKGMPIVATKAGGIPETVENGVESILVEPSNPEALANAIAEVVSNTELMNRLAENAYKRVVRDYSIQSVSRKLEGIYIESMKDK